MRAFSHVLEEQAVLASAPDLDSCPDCGDTQFNRGGDKVCAGCGNRQPIVTVARHDWPFVAKMVVAANRHWEKKAMGGNIQQMALQAIESELKGPLVQNYLAMAQQEQRQPSPEDMLAYLEMQRPTDDVAWEWLGEPEDNAGIDQAVQVIRQTLLEYLTQNWSTIIGEQSQTTAGIKKRAIGDDGPNFDDHYLQMGQDDLDHAAEQALPGENTQNVLAAAVRGTGMSSYGQPEEAAGGWSMVVGKGENELYMITVQPVSYDAEGNLQA